MSRECYDCARRLSPFKAADDANSVIVHIVSALLALLPEPKTNRRLTRLGLNNYVRD